MILLLGAPCSGKSTIGQLLCQQTGKKLVVLDDFIDGAVTAENIKKGVSLTDEFIERVVDDFFGAMRNDTDRENSIYELPFHHYESLFVNKLLIQGTVLICLYCDYNVLIERNSLRDIEKQIPMKYILRCVHSVKKMKEMGNDEIHFFDTSNKTPRETSFDIITTLSSYD